MKAVILAGGEGKRLRPYTEIIPKPLLPVNGEPVLGIIIKKLKEQGIEEIILAVNYRDYLFKTLFGDGSNFGVKIYYSGESEPLGTCGPVKNVENLLDDDFFVMNGDLITDVDIREVEKFHKKNNADITVVTKMVENKINFGVMKVKDDEIISWDEKPTIKSEIGTGMYVINPRALMYIPPNKFYNMNDLVSDVIMSGGKVMHFLHEGDWVDIGLKDDYEKVQNIKSSEKIIITGDNGLIGRRLKDSLKEKFDVIGFSSNKKNVKNKEDFSDLNGTCIIHLAGLMRGESEQEMFETNVLGTLNALEFCRKNKAKMIFISSAAVYGNVTSPIREDSLITPKNFYGLTKLMGENLCESYHKKYGIPVVILRLFNVYGPNQKKGFLVSDIVSQLGKSEITLRNPFPKNDFIHVDDVVEAIKRSMKIKTFEVINIGSGKSFSVKDLAEKATIGKKTLKFSDNSFSSSDVYADISKAKKILDWEPKINIDDGLKRIVENYK
ncbi:MAG: sugar phosphate nucleotidyltransferase [Nanoarchaeota archaeon]